MFALLQKSWAKQLKLGPEAQNLPLYSALILINALVGILVAWLVTVLNQPTGLVILLVFIYLTLAFQHQTILRRWANMPLAYRVVGWPAQMRYRLWIWLRLNPLTYAFVAFSVILWILGPLSGRWGLLLAWLNLAAFALVYLSAKNWPSIWASPLRWLSLAVLMVGYLTLLDGRWPWLSLATLAFLLAAWGHVLYHWHDQDNLAAKRVIKGRLGRGFNRLLAGRFSWGSLGELVLIIAGLFAREVWHWPIPVLTIPVLFYVVTLEIYCQTILNGNRHLIARITFLANQSLWQQVRYGSLARTGQQQVVFVGLLAWPLVAGGNFWVLVQWILALVVLIALQFYTAIVGRQLVVKQEKRPKFWEEYLLVLVLIGLAWVDIM
ncbi:hypothetical protein PUF88_05365 [Lactobacillaceae bacterium L1_55_11]|nr:hypothetical protein [Lactobacillaceae bacterium L1_55_11]